MATIALLAILAILAVLGLAHRVARTMSRGGFDL
jgi:hypothetical protein